MGKMKAFMEFIEEENLFDRFIQEVMCEGYYGYDFMNDNNPLKNVFIRYCLEQMEIKKEEEEEEEEEKEKEKPNNMMKRFLDYYEEKKDKEEEWFKMKMTHLDAMRERNRQKEIKRWNDLEEQGRKEVENETI